MKADVRREQISTEKDRVLDALLEAEKVRREISDRAGMSGVITGVDLQQIQRELFNPDNSILLTDIGDTIVRDRLSRLIEDGLIFTKKMGRERIYMSPRTVEELDVRDQELDQKRQDRQDRLHQLSEDLGYEVEWLTNAKYFNRQNKVAIMIEDLEAIAENLGSKI